MVGALGTVSTDHTQYLKILSNKINPNIVQKTVLLGTANILQSVLSIATQDGVKKNDLRGNLGTPVHPAPV